MAAANLISSAQAKRYEAVPVAFIGETTLRLAMADPGNVMAIDEVALVTGFEVRPAVASREDIHALITRLSRLDEVVHDAIEEGVTDVAEIVDLRESADDAPVIKLVNSIIAQGVEQGASDIHFAPDGHELRVRFRIDGVLQETTTIPKRMVAGAISRVKIMSDLDIAERRIPQDGRVGLTIDRKHIDLRVVTLPSVHGESIVVRILDQDGNVAHDLDEARLPRGRQGPLRARDPPAVRRRARDRPDRLRQVDDALHGRRDAQLGREEHHHDRGSGRVPDRRASRRCRSTRAPA